MPSRKQLAYHHHPQSGMLRRPVAYIINLWHTDSRAVNNQQRKRIKLNNTLTRVGTAKPP
jgi:hypothetical protein